jgi:uroporphyrinogen decarboxylase
MLPIMEQTNKIFLNALSGKKTQSTPIWLMRQAGRYLPEYREIRTKAGSFLDLVYNPDFASEVALQPLRRYGFDAAILFSDILVVPHALGQKLEFVEGEGPKLDPIKNLGDLGRLNHSGFNEKIKSVYESVVQTKEKMATEGFSNTALIGFAGAPWTVACYMIEGGASRDFERTKKWAYSDPESFGKLIDVIVSVTIEYLSGQIDSGVEAIQIFESWAGVLDSYQFSRWVVNPTKKIVDALKLSYPHIPVIGFPKGAGRLIQDYVQSTGINAVSIDSNTSPRWAAGVIQPVMAVQGNLDPICLLAGGDAMAMTVEDIMGNLSHGAFVFNLGHGIHKDTNPNHVAELVNLVRSYG